MMRVKTGAILRVFRVSLGRKKFGTFLNQLQYVKATFLFDNAHLQYCNVVLISCCWFINMGRTTNYTVQQQQNDDSGGTDIWMKFSIGKATAGSSFRFRHLKLFESGGHNVWFKIDFF